MRGKARALAYSSLSAAAGVTALYLGSVLPGARISILCIAALGTAFAALSCSARWALCCYAVTGVLSLLILPEKTIAFIYMLLPGYYPVFKLRAERFGNGWARWGLKLALFHAAFAAAVLIGRLYAPLAVLLSGASFWLIWAGALAVFLLFDYVLGLLILYYLRKISGRLK